VIRRRAIDDPVEAAAKAAPAAAPDAETAWLHRGGRGGHWGSLGLWPRPGVHADYAAAAEALALAVADAAALAPGAAIASLACGAGDELLTWARRHGVRRVVAVERNAARLAMAARRAAAAGLRVEPFAGDALTAMRALAGQAPALDAVCCVDGAYHLGHPDDWTRAAAALLRPGGRIAFTDLVLHGRAPHAPLPPMLRLAAAACGVGIDGLLDPQARAGMLERAGFDSVRWTVLDDEVLGGFAAFAGDATRRPGAEPWRRGGWRPWLTARLIGTARRRGLGYALFAARRAG
jgi:SAM-dependent methyltransferase